MRARSSPCATTPIWPAPTVAIASVDGAPADVSTRFRQSLDEAAAARRIAVAAPAKAHYLVRGYVTASLIEGGAEIDIVWDVFTPDKQRAQRLSDAIAVKGSGDDAWAMIDDAALNSVAAKCADDLAAYLSNTPRPRPRAQRSATPNSFFLWTAAPANARRDPCVMLFERPSGCYDPPRRALKRARKRAFGE